MSAAASWAEVPVAVGAAKGEPAVVPVEFDAGWASFGGGIHGGLVAGTLIRAAEQLTGRAARAASVHLHRPTDAGVGEVVLTPDRIGRAVASVRTELRQDRLRAGAVVLLSGAAAAGPGGGVDVPTPGDGLFTEDPLAGEELKPVMVVPFSRHLEYRPVGATRPLGGGQDPFLAAWLRFRGGRPAVWGPVETAVALDALAPSLFAVRTAPVAAPTVEFTLHLTGHVPSGEWLQVRQRMVWASAGLCQDDAELRDDRGTLIATSRQLRALPAG